MSTSSDPNRPFIIGITGKIACGKSAVMNLLREKGVETIDADKVYHELIRPGLPLWETLRHAFGEEIIGENGEIDRKALGAIVFSDPEVLRRLDELTHPAVVAETERLIASSTAKVIAIDAVKLVESGMDRRCDVVWRVSCNPTTQVERLMRRNGISEGEAKRRIAAQPSPPKSTRPETTIANDADLAALRSQVEAAWQALVPTLTR
jgi:dephospho-CoA kinase